MRITAEHKGRKLDRVFRQKDRQHQSRYPMAAVLTDKAALTPDQQKALDRGWRNWSPPPILDQGEEGACTGFSAASYINAGPVKPKKLLTADDARAIYARAKLLDDFPGEDYEGSTVDAAAKALREQGRIVAFHWGREITTIVTALLIEGPVMLGIDWTEDMYDPVSPDGTRGLPGIITTGRGNVVGGHALTAIGLNIHTKFAVGGVVYEGVVTLANSWGKGWGLGGFAHIPISELAKLIDGIESPGDACLATERRA